MTDDLMDALASAVEGKLCGVSACTAKPVTTRDGQHLCDWHRRVYDHGTLGTPCEHCGGRQWVVSPDAAYHAVCATCERVTDDESVTEDSW